MWSQRLGGSVVCLLLSSLWLRMLPAESWINPAGGSFQNPNNWAGLVIPDQSDTATHDLASPGYTVSSSARIDVAGLHVIDDVVTYDLNGSVLFAGGGSAQSATGAAVIPTAGNSRLTLLDGTFDLSTGLYVNANPATGTANITIGAGATVRTGTQADVPDLVAVGGNGTGSLTVNGGALYDAFQPQVGNDIGDVGILNVSGPGTVLDNINPGADASTIHAMAIGLDGTGTLNITNGGLVQTQFLGVAGGFTGLNGVGVGTVNVDNASLFHFRAFDDPDGTIVDLGDGGGTATMNLTNNAVFATDSLVIAGGTVPGNSATINVMSGSDWTSGQWRLGEDLGNSATMHLDGAGTTMIAEFGSFVGYQGAGQFNVTGGATARFIPDPITPNTGFLGLARLGAGSSGVMTIDGIGSMVSVEGALPNAISIGRDGTATATVSNGGLLTTVPGGDISIGRTSTATGVLIVTGAGAIVRGHNGINVGGTAAAAGNSGTLFISNGGSIQTANLLIYAGDAVSVITGGFGTIGTIGTVVNTPNTLTVRTGGTLRGVGTINGNVTNVTGGIVSPGTGTMLIGLLAINGTLNLGNCLAGAGGTYNMGITNAGTAGTSYDSMTVSGSVLLGGTLNVIVAGTYVPSGAHQFNVFTGSSNIVGAVQTITNRVINPAVIGGTIWGDYREDNAGTGTDRYYLAPRRNADFNGTGGVTGADYTLWADNFGRPWATFGEGDANGDRQVTGADFTLWADNFGQASLDTDGVAVNTYGYGVDISAVDSAVDGAVTPDSEFDAALQAIRTMPRLSGAGLPSGTGSNSVPEPSSLVLGAIAIIVLSVYGRRRHRA